MKKQWKQNKGIWMALVLVGMYLLSFLLLLAASGILWNVGAPANMVSGVMIGIYVVVNIVGGYAIGKKIGQHKMAWGAILGLLYFTILLLLSIVVVKNDLQGNTWVYSGYFVCGISAMVGGMFAPAKK